MRIIFLLLFIVPFICAAQDTKIDKKTGLVTVNGQSAFRFEKDGCGFAAGVCNYDVYDTTGTRVLRILMKTQRSRSLMTAENPAGEVTYFQFLFLKTKQTADVTDLMAFEKYMIPFIVKNKLFAKGMLDESRVEEFVLLHGSPFSAAPKG
jgi:hypothetical protein